METRTNWGIIAFACVFVALAIGVAVSTVYFDDVAATIAPITGGAVRNDSDWRASLAAIASSTVDENGNYRAPKELSTTEALSRELFISYLQLKGDGLLTQAEIDSSVDELVARNIVPITPTTNYTVGSLAIDSSTSLETYTGTLGDALKASTEIREYELTTFARTVGQKDYNGTPELATAAQIYKGIERDLVKMKVPNALAGEHLELLKSVAMLGQTTNLLATWGGDPIEALANVNAFAKAERSVQVAINALFAEISAVAKQS